MEKLINHPTDRDPYKDLTRDQVTELEKYIFDNLQRTGQAMTRLHVSAILYQYGQIFDLAAMYRFKTWMESHGYTRAEDNDLIFSTMIHDLNGSRDPYMFCPRTADY